MLLRPALLAALAAGAAPGPAAADGGLALLSAGSLPVCDLHVPEVPVRGQFQRREVTSTANTEGPATAWAFASDEGCAYGLRDAPQVAECLRGSWLIVAGASNTEIWTAVLANSLAEGALSVQQDGFRIDGVFTLLLDLVIEDGKVLYRNVVTDDRFRSGTVAGARTAARDRQVLALAFAEVHRHNVKYSDRAIRITHFVAEYWDEVPLVLSAVKRASGEFDAAFAAPADASWAHAEVSLVVSMGLWYAFSYQCRPDTWCSTRPEYSSLSLDSLIDQYERDMAEAWPSLDRFCAAEGGRAGVRGCSLLTFAHCSDMQGEVWVRMSAVARQRMRATATGNMRFVDIWTLALQLPDECLAGHQTPMSAQWTWQAIFGGICQAGGASGAAAGPAPSPGFAVFEGQSCSAAQVGELCDPEAAVAKGFRYSWECAAATPCRLTVVSPPSPRPLKGFTLDSMAGAGGAAVRVDFEAASSVGDAARRPPWPAGCGDPALVLPMVTAALAFGVLLWSRTFRSFAAEGAGGFSYQLLLTSDECSSCRCGSNVRGGAPGEGAPVPAVVEDGAEGPDDETDDDDEEDDDEDDEDDKGAEDGLQEEVLEVGTSRVGFSSPNKGAPLFSSITGRWRRSSGKSSPRRGRRWRQERRQRRGGVGGASGRGAAARPGGEEARAGVELQRFPFGPLRCLASLHIVAGHLCAKEALGGGCAYFFTWGFTWVPWFFVVSGFVLASSQAQKETEASSWSRSLDYVCRRAVGIYPLYGATLLAAAAIAQAEGRRPGLFELLAEVWLMQAWIPSLTEQALQMQCWFLSCLVVYWMAFFPLFAAVQRLRTIGAVLAAMLLLWVLPALLACAALPAAFEGFFVSTAAGPSSYIGGGGGGGGIGAGEGSEWSEAHHFGSMSSVVDVTVVFLKYHPLAFLPSFAFGLVLARLRALLWPIVELGPSARPASASTSTSASPLSVSCWARVAMQALAPGSLLCLLLLFSNPSLRPPGAPLSVRLSLLLPLQGGVVLGLAGLPGEPPLRLARACAGLNWLERYAYAIYLLQFVCYHLWPNHTVGPGFFVFLLAASVLAVHLVQVPATALLQRRSSHVLLLPMMLLFALEVLRAVPIAPWEVELAPFYELRDFGVDLRLPLAAPGAGGGGGGGGGGGRDGDGAAPGDGAASLINPSLLIRPRIAAGGHELVIAARRHAWSSRRVRGIYENQDVHVLEQTWHSDIVVGTVPIEQELVDRWLSGAVPMEFPTLRPWTGLRTSSGEHWAQLCARESYMPENNTLVRSIVTGPEDAQLFQTDSDFGSTGVALAFNSYPPSTEYDCGKDGTFSQMYLADGVIPAAARDERRAFRLACGHRGRSEKNWTPFQKDGALFFVYSIVPHVVVEAHSADGSCGLRHYSNFDPLVRLQAEHPTLALRGSAGAVLVDDAEATPGLPRPHFLALLHVVDTRTQRYAHFAYRFSTEAPFEILQVSEQLPLRALPPKSPAGPDSPAFAFASGLALFGRRVLIAYGAGDRESRMLVMSLRRLDALFASSSSTSASASSTELRL